MFGCSAQSEASGFSGLPWRVFSDFWRTLETVAQLFSPHFCTAWVSTRFSKMVHSVGKLQGDCSKTTSWPCGFALSSSPTAGELLYSAMVACSQATLSRWIHWTKKFIAPKRVQHRWNYRTTYEKAVTLTALYNTLHSFPLLPQETCCGETKCIPVKLKKLWEEQRAQQMC